MIEFFLEIRIRKEKLILLYAIEQYCREAININLCRDIYSEVSLLSIGCHVPY
jgi:hypothetical protein